LFKKGVQKGGGVSAVAKPTTEDAWGGERFDKSTETREGPRLSKEPVPRATSRLKARKQRRFQGRKKSKKKEEEDKDTQKRT